MTKPRWAGRASARSVRTGTLKASSVGPREREPAGAEPLSLRAKAVDGVKSLDEQHLRTRRRRGDRTCTRSTVEQERSVSARKRKRPWGAIPRRPVVGVADKRQHRETVARRAEVGAGDSSEDGGETRSERRTCSQVRVLVGEGSRDCRLAASHPPSWSLRTVPDAGVVGQPGWRWGMSAVDCLGESRMREIFMSGSGRGRWRRRVTAMVA
jgi:hypothetical protein